MQKNHVTTVLTTEEAPRRLAVLIDADNAQAAIVDNLLREIAQYGEAIVKRIYGDFTTPHTASWKKVLNQHAIKPMQQFAYTTGKNATDSTLIIDAMDLLYTRRFDGFCLISSDSDFTGLAMRLREEGLMVLGFGETKTPQAFRNACHKFVFTEVLRPEPLLADADVPAGLPTTSLPTSPMPDIDVFLRQALAEAVDDSGWVHLGTYGSYLSKIRPDFDSRNHGHKKLSDLVKSRPTIFETEERANDNGSTSLYLRPKS